MTYSIEYIKNKMRYWEYQWFQPVKEWNLDFFSILSLHIPRLNFYVVISCVISAIKLGFLFTLKIPPHLLHFWCNGWTKFTKWLHSWYFGWTNTPFRNPFSLTEQNSVAVLFDFYAVRKMCWKSRKNVLFIFFSSFISKLNCINAFLLKMNKIGFVEHSIFFRFSCNQTAFSKWIWKRNLFLKSKKNSWPVSIQNII